MPLPHSISLHLSHSISQIYCDWPPISLRSHSSPIHLPLQRELLNLTSSLTCWELLLQFLLPGCFFLRVFEYVSSGLWNSWNWTKFYVHLYGYHSLPKGSLANRIFGVVSGFSQDHSPSPYRSFKHLSMASLTLSLLLQVLNTKPFTVFSTHAKLPLTSCLWPFAPQSPHLIQVRSLSQGFISIQHICFIWLISLKILCFICCKNAITYYKINTNLQSESPPEFQLQR